MNFKKDSQKGIALLMVTTSIALLTGVMLTFTFEGQLNKIKVYNMEDRLRAKMNAESGLMFAMARLRIYKEAYNLINNQGQNSQFASFKPIINQIWQFPFVYPLPVTKDMNATQKDAIGKFSEQILLDGQMNITINNISNKLNINALRISALIGSRTQLYKTQDELEKIADETSPIFQSLTSQLRQSIIRKSEEDPVFKTRYDIGMEELLLASLYTNISDQENARSDILGDYNAANIAPKFAALSSFSEIYALPYWDDVFVDMIKNDYTAHSTVMIDLNKLTADGLRAFMPLITEDSLNLFFKEKNDPNFDRFFETEQEFIDYWSKEAGVISSQELQETFALFKRWGVQFGISPTLFEITSIGSYERATYELKAIVSLPPQPLPPPPPPQYDENGNLITNTQTQGQNPTTGNGTEESTQQTTTPTEQPLLEPRIIEIHVK